MKIAIVGYGEQGRSAYEYWNKPENQLVICDQDETITLPEGVEYHSGADYLKGLSDYDCIIRAPSVHPRDIVAANGEAILSKVTSNTNEFMRVCPSRNIIGVTGTKGKGTTSTLITRILEATGKTVHLGGNIGIPPLDLLKNQIKAEDWVVLELANFQVIDLQASPHIAVCLMVVPEHLNWHKDMAEYIAAKQQLFRYQTPQDIAIYFADNDNSKQVVSVSPGQHIPYFAQPGALVENGQITISGQKICRTDELQLLGEHNWQNVCAAVTATWQVLQDASACRKVLISFAGLEHRLEFVREQNKVRYFNDSFASAPDASMAALDAITGKKVMIIGGFERHLPLEHFAQAIADHASDLRTVLIIGESAERMAAALQAVGFSNYTILTTKHISEIVMEASHSAKSGDSVILSPGFASFDMFKNFEVRGNQFKQEVMAL